MNLKGKKPFQFVVTASAISYLPLPGYALYSGTKHAVQGFFEAARHELPKHQVITLIHPIATKTAFFKENTPVPFPLVQQYNNKEYRTTFKGKGTGRLATMVDLKINPEMFPGIDSIKPIAIIQVSPFNITFPVADISI